MSMTTSPRTLAPQASTHAGTFGRLTELLSYLRGHPSAVVGAILIAGIVMVTLGFELVWSLDPLAQDLLGRLKPPMWQEAGGWAHPLGTDNLGRDVLARILHGSRISLGVAASAVLMAALAGTLLGLLAGYYGGAFDAVTMRVADVFLAYPFMLLTISVIAVLGTSILNLILVLGLSDWVIYARTTRSSVLSLRERDFVRAAHAIGASDGRILAQHILPNALSPILVLATVRMASVIVWESGLSFLGMGAPPPTATWGRMLAEGRSYISDAWWLVTLPGVAIMLTILAINLFGDGMRDALDPRIRNSIR
jgi:ABC-type dipeptide/oligopeptide/nickel transport system permease subunit